MYGRIEEIKGTILTCSEIGRPACPFCNQHRFWLASVSPQRKGKLFPREPLQSQWCYSDLSHISLTQVPDPGYTSFFPCPSTHHPLSLPWMFPSCLFSTYSQTHCVGWAQPMQPYPTRAGFSAGGAVQLLAPVCWHKHAMWHICNCSRLAQGTYVGPRGIRIMP